MSDLSEVDGTCSCVLRSVECGEHPSGIYGCNCGKLFHGHWDRDFHSATCPVMIEARNKAIIEPALRELQAKVLAVVEGLTGFAQYVNPKTGAIQLKRTVEGKLVSRAEVESAIREVTG